SLIIPMPLVVKESSDELNPPVAAEAPVARAPRRRTAGDYLALALATWGVGFIPGAPGTYGSAVGVGVYLLVQSAGAQVSAIAAARGWGPAALASFRVTFMLLVIAGITLAGVWAATRVETLLGRKDPGVVVADEVAGQLIAFLFVPVNVGWWAIIAGFALFRLFDIWKPYPIRRLEALESGLGIMADDVLAGVYAAIVMSLLVSISLS
ncbi:MAG TPA: phosphatidylglycerophosphatase A, partial [Pyrinomonadaceae bacterium]|nr:phosphatidylglycerophosphatase A [Pyrinomonadaceae bacterium]